MIRERSGRHVQTPLASRVIRPGLISTSCPTLNTPCRILPPATPPFSSSTVAPGLLTSNDRMTTIRGSAVKSYLGGAIFEIASTTASMLNFSWAETGMMGARPAVVPGR